MNPKKLLRKVAPKGAIKIAEESYRKGRLATTHFRYGFPAKNLRVIGVTGSNGKTSTCNFINDVLKSLGYRTALYTTAVIELDGDREINTNHTTVPKTGQLFRFLKQAKLKSVDFVVLEITSHALHQHKAWGIPIEIAVMTNLSQDHLDYHGTMQNYALAKARLFGKYMNPKWCVLNADDEWYDFFHSQAVGQICTYGKNKNSDVQLSSINTNAEGLGIRFDMKNLSVLTKVRLIGEFNAYNLGAVVAVLNILGVTPEKIRNSINSVSSVPGRMEMIQSSVGFTAVVDYAHTPDAIEKALQALKNTTKGQVSIVFGATGDRDKTKRPIMGEVAAKNADKIYLTDDETYTENGDEIRKSVFEGIVRAGGRSKTIEIADRRSAIEKAFKEAKKNDMILIAGLGHQNYRAMNEGNIAWQEAEVVKEILSDLKML